MLTCLFLGFEKGKKKEGEIENRLLRRKLFQARDDRLCSLWLPSHPFPGPDTRLAGRKSFSQDCSSSEPGWQGTKANPIPPWVPNFTGGLNIPTAWRRALGHAKSFSCSLNSPLRVHSVIVPISQMSKLRLREVKWLIHGHTASQG